MDRTTDGLYPLETGGLPLGNRPPPETEPPGTTLPRGDRADGAGAGRARPVGVD